MNKIRTFYGLLSKLKLKHRKAALISGYDVTSTKQLTDQQLDELIVYLRSLQDKHKAPVEEPIRKGRSDVLALLQKMGIYRDNKDWSRVNAYLSQPKVCGKLLYELNLHELDALRSKLYAIYRKQQKKQAENDYLAANN